MREYSHVVWREAAEESNTNYSPIDVVVKQWFMCQSAECPPSAAEDASLKTRQQQQ